jgi:predicted regulator of Ras-like GTPase activity (Roadblock/LC7/MglB family)
VPPKQITGSHPVPKGATGPQLATNNARNTTIQPASPEWQPPEDNSPGGPKQIGPLKSLSHKTDDLIKNAVPQEHVPLVVKGQVPTVNGALAASGATVDGEIRSSALWRANRSATGPFLAVKRNYSALVAALETLGYSVPGFVASAVVNLNGQPIAQVAVDEIDISLMCGYFTTIVQGALLSLDQGRWGQFGQTVITSATHHILLRIVGSEKDAFQVLITTHESDPTASLEAMANVDSAIASALR